MTLGVSEAMHLHYSDWYTQCQLNWNIRRKGVKLQITKRVAEVTCKDCRDVFFGDITPGMHELIPLDDSYPPDRAS